MLSKNTVLNFISIYKNPPYIRASVKNFGSGYPVRKRMEDIFNKLKKEGKTSVDNLVKWMQDSELVAKTDAAAEEARKLFTDVTNKASVEFDQFKKAVEKLAKEQKKPIEDMTKNLIAEGTKTLEAAAAAAKAGANAAAKAFTDAMKK